MADQEKIEFNEEQYNKALPLIKTQLKALIARDLWDMNEYFQVMNKNKQKCRTGTGNIEIEGIRANAEINKNVKRRLQECTLL